VLVSAAAGPFAPQGAIYRRGLEEHGPLVKVAGGLPAWLDGKVDTRCIATHGPAVVAADMGGMGSADSGLEWWKQDIPPSMSKQTRPLGIIKEPASGNGELTLAEAAMLYRAFFPPDEQIDLSNLRRRFLATNRLEALDEERPVRGRELDWRRVSRAYRYLNTTAS